MVNKAERHSDRDGTVWILITIFYGKVDMRDLGGGNNMGAIKVLVSAVGCLSKDGRPPQQFHGYLLCFSFQVASATSFSPLGGGGPISVHKKGALTFNIISI